MAMTPTVKPPQTARRQAENGFKYKPKFGLVVPCKDEADQQRNFARLVKLGLKPKVVCV